MANTVIKATLNNAIPGGGYSVSTGAAPDSTTVAANIATLVADGATPTQAHVTTLNANWALLLPAYSGNATLIFDSAVVTNMNQLRAILRAIEQSCAGRLTA